MSPSKSKKGWFTVVDKSGRTVAIVRKEEHAEVFVNALGRGLRILRSTDYDDDAVDDNKPS